ncbi:zinc ribbon domain protein [mine drainage metagenome]|uniref:Zinc ribbon domain protein n=1 Tax=mine drainage metagenome TaxID=410659 RepID=A0A1J5R039_9ZZZZ
MPIYGYHCSSCGLSRDVLQKMSDSRLTTCPECGKETFSRQLSAPGFQLKGSGWYASDFKGGAKPAAESAPVAKEDSAPAATPCGGSCACH